MAGKLNTSRVQGIMGEKIWSKRRALGQAGSDSQALFPRGCLDDHAAAACVSQGMVFWMDLGQEKELWAQPRIGLAWQRVSGLFFSGCAGRDRL